MRSPSGPRCSPPPRSAVLVRLAPPRKRASGEGGPIDMCGSREARICAKMRPSSALASAFCKAVVVVATGSALSSMTAA
eukprot:2061010-Pyramimonas_sp.AAC.1